MTGAPTLDGVRALAHSLHAGQVDKQGRPYAEHLDAVEAAVAAGGGSLHQRMAALLHDCVEDGHATLGQLGALHVPGPVLALVDALTARPGEPRPAYIARVLAVPDAVPVKEADLDHNEGRIGGIASVATRARLRAKYARDRAQIAHHKTRAAGGPTPAP